MDERYTKLEIREIAEHLVEELREYEDGTVTTTADLAQDQGYIDMETFNLFDLHDALFKAARSNHITLDMSEHEGIPEGLPYNLTFVVRNKRAQIKCPRCGSRNTARYLYGYPLFSEIMQKKLDDGKLALGGCCISSVEIDGQRVETMPARKCNDCKKDFATAPILMTPSTGMVEDYRDIVKTIKFSVGGYFNGYTDITIRKNDKGAIVQVNKMLASLDDWPDDRQISITQWQKIINTLYGQMYLHEWEKSFVDPCVMDGTQWSLEISLTNKRKRSYSGSNDYPPYWNELMKIFKKFTKIP